MSGTDEAVISDWWQQLDMPNRVALLYYGDPYSPELQVGAATLAQSSYQACQQAIQQIIEKAFVSGRDANEYWYGIEWSFECPLCEQRSDERGSIRFASENPRDVVAFLETNGAKCMNCHQYPPPGTDVHLQIFNAPFVVLQELGFAPSDVARPVQKRYFDAWKQAKGRELLLRKT